MEGLEAVPLLPDLRLQACPASWTGAGYPFPVGSLEEIDVGKLGADDPGGRANGVGIAGRVGEAELRVGGLDGGDGSGEAGEQELQGLPVFARVISLLRVRAGVVVVVGIWAAPPRPDDSSAADGGSPAAAMDPGDGRCRRRPAGRAA